MTGKIPARVARLPAWHLPWRRSRVGGDRAGERGAEIIYNNLELRPGNVVSQAFEATRHRSSAIRWNSAKRRSKTPTIAVVMSSWACESGTWNNDNCVTKAGAKFEWPIKWDVYNVGPARTRRADRRRPGALQDAIPAFGEQKCTPPQKARRVDPRAAWSRARRSRSNSRSKASACPARRSSAIAYNTSDYGATPQRPSSDPNDRVVGRTRSTSAVRRPATVNAVGSRRFPTTGYLALMERGLLQRCRRHRQFRIRAAVRRYKPAAGCWRAEADSTALPARRLPAAPARAPAYAGPSRCVCSPVCAGATPTLPACRNSTNASKCRSPGAGHPSLQHRADRRGAGDRLAEGRAARRGCCAGG